MPGRSHEHEGDSTTPRTHHPHIGSVRAGQEAVAAALRKGRAAHLGDAKTRASGTAGGIPEGHPTRVPSDDDEFVRRSIAMENSAAATLADRGWRIKQNPTADEIARARQATGDRGNPIKRPDYLLEGKVFDCISPTKPDKTPRNIWSDVKVKIDLMQTQRVVVNLADWRGDLSALRAQFADWPMPGLKEVKAITPDGDIVQIDLTRPANEG